MFTKGDWKVIDDHEFIDIMAGKGIIITSMRKDYPNSESNASLIAAAPAMYEALKELEHFYHIRGGELSLKARQALSKAENKYKEI
jgi:hypothetical protein